MLGFLENVDDKDYSEILKLFRDKVSIESSLKTASNELRAKMFIDIHCREHSQKRVEQIVTHMSQLMITEKLDFSFAQYSRSFFKMQKVDPAYIEMLIKSKNPYEQLASIYFAKNTYTKDQFREFYKQNLSSLHHKILHDKHVGTTALNIQLWREEQKI